MKNIEIELQINDYKLNTNGIIDNNILIFFDKDENKTITKIDLINNIITRDNKKMLIEMNFNEKKIKYILKNINQVLTEEIKVLLLDKKDNKMSINYKLIDAQFDFAIEYKEVL